MKRWICLGLVLGLTAGAASAQTSSGQSSRTTSISSTGNYQAKKTQKTSRKVFLEPSKVLDNRKIFQWETGQRSTPTGREAASINGGYQSLKRQPATVKQEEEE